MASLLQLHSIFGSPCSAAHYYDVLLPADLADPSPLEGLCGDNIFAACLMYTCMVTQASEPRVCNNVNDFLQDLNDVVPLVDPQPMVVLE